MGCKCKKQDTTTDSTTIEKWLHHLNLQGWKVGTIPISREQVVFPSDISEDEMFFVGVHEDRPNKIAHIFHDRELTEEDIVHELIHVRFPDWKEEKVRSYTTFIMEVKK